MDMNLRRVNSPMATASLIMGILALANLLFALLPFAMFFAIMAIIFAHLSKTESELYGHAKAGFICGMISVAVNIIVLAAVICLILFSANFRHIVVEPIINNVEKIFDESDDFTTEYHYNDDDSGYPIENYKDNGYYYHYYNPFNGYYYEDSYPSVNNGTDNI